MPKKIQRKNKSVKLKNSSKSEQEMPKIVHVYPATENSTKGVQEENKEQNVCSSSQCSNKTMYYIIGVVVVLVLILFFSGKINSSSEVSENTLASVNGIEITQTDLDEEIAKLPKQIIQSQNKENVERLVLEQLVLKKLLLNEIEKSDVQVNEDEVQEAIQNAKVQIGVSEEEFKTALEKQGLSIKLVEDTYREQLLISKYFLKAVPLPDVSDKTVEEYYNNNKESLQQVHASHVLVCWTGKTLCQKERTKEDALEMITDTHKKAKAGDDFAELARKYSDDPGAANGGDLGFFSKDDMVPEFADAVFKLNSGDVSEVIETEFGYHVAKVSAKQVSLEELKEPIKKALQREQQQVRLKEYLESLKASADIVYYNKALYNDSEKV